MYLSAADTTTMTTYRELIKHRGGLIRIRDSLRTSTGVPYTEPDEIALLISIPTDQFNYTLISKFSGDILPQTDSNGDPIRLVIQVLLRGSLATAAINLKRVDLVHPDEGHCSPDDAGSSE